MGKIINEYNGITAYQIKVNADIPDQSDMIVNGSTVDCSNITIPKVKNVLGESTTSVGNLCQSPNINKGANFRPSGTAPYKLSDFAGYNHNAYPSVFWYSEIQNPLPATYSGGGIPISLPIAKGERPPEKDNVNYSWDRIKIELNTTGGLTSSLTNTVAITGTTMSGSLTPVNFTIPIASNDYYTANGVVRGYYVSAGGTKLDEIPNLYRSFSIDVVPTFTSININTTLGARPSDYMLYYRLTSGGGWTRAQNAFSLLFNPNISTPETGSWDPPFTPYEFFIMYRINSTYYKADVTMVTNNQELKINNQWYRYNVTGYADAFVVTFIGNGGAGYPTINYGSLNWSVVTT